MSHTKDVVDRRPGNPTQLPPLDRPGLDSYEFTGTRSRVSDSLTPFLKQLS
jgi:hypothetical protein